MVERGRTRVGGRRLAMGGVALLALLAGTSPSAARPRVRAVGTEPLVLLQGDEPTPKDVEPLVPVPEGARARYFRLDAAGFAADLAGAPTGEDGWRDRTSTCRSLAPRDLVLELLHSRSMLSRLPFALGPLEGHRLAIDVPALTLALGSLIRSDVLTAYPYPAKIWTPEVVAA